MRPLTVTPRKPAGNSPTDHSVDDETVCTPGSGPGRALGVYIHFPYCLKKCPYCDFVSFAAKRPEIPHARYADAVLAELAHKLPEVQDRQVSSVFFGGGTPSLWEPAELGRVLSAVREALPFQSDVEITMECNPSSLAPERAAAFVAQGVNRLSVGLQALETRRLEFLGRLHNESEGLDAVRGALVSGAERVSADLIFAVEGGSPQSPADAASDALRVAALGLSHISAYGLTIEPGTFFGELDRRKSLPVASDDTVLESFLAVHEALTGAGFSHYEISNYAKPGHEARHNLGYWRGLDYLGLGCGAVETLRGERGAARRRKNARDPAKYMRRALAHESTADETEQLDAEARLSERIMLGLRLSEGIDFAALDAEYGQKTLTEARQRELDKLQRRGLVEVCGSHVRVSDRGRPLTDTVVLALF